MDGDLSWRVTIEELAHEFPHQVRLTHADLWRSCHTGHAVYHLDANAYRRWSEGEAVFVFGFKTADDAAAFKAWSETCGIDWTLPADEQANRPPKPAARPMWGEPNRASRGYQGD
jgi:hypothetical protein